MVLYVCLWSTCYIYTSTFQDDTLNSRTFLERKKEDLFSFRKSNFDPCLALGVPNLTDQSGVWLTLHLLQQRNDSYQLKDDTFCNRNLMDFPLFLFSFFFLERCADHHGTPVGPHEPELPWIRSIMLDRRELQKSTLERVWQLCERASSAAASTVSQDGQTEV